MNRTPDALSVVIQPVCLCCASCSLCFWLSDKKQNVIFISMGAQHRLIIIYPSFLPDCAAAAFEEGDWGSVAAWCIRGHHGWGGWRGQILWGGHRPDPPAQDKDHHHRVRRSRIHFCQGKLQIQPLETQLKRDHWQFIMFDQMQPPWWKANLIMD